MNGLSNSSGGGRKKKHVPKTVNVFLYGIEHIEKLRNIVDNNEIISNKAYIMNYIKFFCGFDEKLQSSVVSIINMNDVKTRGSMVTITEDEYDLLKEYYGSNYTEEDVKIFAFKNIKNELKLIEENGRVFIYNDKEWTNHPSIEYLNECVKHLYSHWADLDGNKEYHIRDLTTKLKGVYNMKTNDYEEITIENVENENNYNKLNEELDLSNSPFYDRLLKKVPELIVKKKVGQYNQYSKNCQWNIRKTPVVITEEEKEK